MTVKKVKNPHAKRDRIVNIIGALLFVGLILLGMFIASKVLH